jgi:drug/metabolite transporter (DMT)-like permease
MLGVAGTLAFTVATNLTSLGATSVLASLYPAITVLLAALVLGERLDTGQRLGIGICMFSVAALA